MRTSSPHRTLAAFLLALFVSGCATNWQSYQPGPDPRAPLPDHIRLHLESGETVTLQNPFIEGDSVYAGRSGSRVERVPVESVTEIEAIAPPSAGQVMAGLGKAALVGVGVLGLLFLAACADSDGFIC